MLKKLPAAVVAVLIGASCVDAKDILLSEAVSDEKTNNFEVIQNAIDQCS